MLRQAPVETVMEDYPVKISVIIPMYNEEEMPLTPSPG